MHRFALSLLALLALLALPPLSAKANTFLVTADFSNCVACVNQLATGTLTVTVTADHLHGGTYQVTGMTGTFDGYPVSLLPPGTVLNTYGGIGYSPIAGE
jgi:hypothetical protein